MPARRTVTWSVALVPLLLTVGLVGCGGSGAGGTGTNVTRTIGGTISGLAVGQTITLLNNGGDSLTLAASDSFTFVTRVPNNGSYAVTTAAQPMWQTCTVTNGSGSAVVTNITAVGVTCSYNAALALVAGSPNGPGNADGPGAGARFFHVEGVAADAAGNVYVADTDNSIIRKISPAAVVTTIAGAAGVVGNADGVGSAARFSYPSSVAVDSAGNVYVADTGNCAVRKITPAGLVTTVAWVPAALTGLAVDGAGNVYVVDQGHGLVLKITPSGVVTTFAAGFSEPWGLAVDNAGYVYLADQGNSVIRKITPTGVVSTLAGAVGVAGTADGPSAEARFQYPSGVTVDGSGNVFVADTLNYTIRKITPNGVVATLAGTAWSIGYGDGAGPAASFNMPVSVAVDSAGNVYVADYWNNTIRKATGAGAVTTFAGTPTIHGSSDGTGAAAGLSGPMGQTTDRTGTVYVADHASNAIRRITPAGEVYTVVGFLMDAGSADGPVGTASLSAPSGIASDGAGNLYVADTNNSTIRKISADHQVSTVAGSPGSDGSADGTGADARFFHPQGVAVDSAGSLYVADTGNHTIRKITQAGVVTTLAGVAGTTGSTDGTGSVARFSMPSALAVDAAGNVYVADTGNHAIRKVTPAGSVTTWAGTAEVIGNADGTGTAASFWSPSGVAMDSAGNLYVSDSNAHTIRKITPARAVTTVVGTAMRSGFQPGDLPGVIGFPSGVAVIDPRIYFTTYDAVAVATGVR